MTSAGREICNPINVGHFLEPVFKFSKPFDSDAECHFTDLSYRYYPLRTTFSWFTLFKTTVVFIDDLALTNRHHHKQVSIRPRADDQLVNHVASHGAKISEFYPEMKPFDAIFHKF